jgi:hypothetical protein
MSIVSFFENLFTSVESEAPVITAAYDQADAFVGFVLGEAAQVTEAVDPVLAPVVASAAAALVALRATAKAAVDAAGADVAASAAAANDHVAAISAAAIALAVTASPVITIIGNQTTPQAA